jgi:hypothetical protein
MYVTIAKTVATMTPWGRYFGVEKCRIWYISYMIYQRGHVLDDVLLVKAWNVWKA